VIVTPQGCICPKQNYTCRAYDVTGMTWNSENIQGILFNKNNPSDKKNVTVGGVQLLFSEDGRNLSSQLFFNLGMNIMERTSLVQPSVITLMPTPM
jgi:hypothetical protein